MTAFLPFFRRGGAPQATTSAPALPGGPRLPPAVITGPPLPPPRVSRPSASATPENAECRRLLFGFDATGSRAGSWKWAMKLTDTLLGALPDQLELALAVHGGGRLHTLTRFTTDAAKLRRAAAKVRCEVGYTRLLDILRDKAALQADLLLYIGDMFEESVALAGKIADRLAKYGTRVIILQEGCDAHARGVFADIAERTGGALLSFDMSSFDRIGTWLLPGGAGAVNASAQSLVEAVALLAVEGVHALEARQEAFPAAKVLLEHLKAPKAISGKVTP